MALFRVKSMNLTGVTEQNYEIYLDIRYPG